MSSNSALVRDVRYSFEKPLRVTPYAEDYRDELQRNFVRTTENPFLLSDPFELYLYVLEQKNDEIFITRLNNSINSIFERSLTPDYDPMFFLGDYRRINIQTRNDLPFGLHQTAISDVRANRPGKTPKKEEENPYLEKKEKDECKFEDHNIGQTPEPRYYLNGYKKGQFSPVSVPNLFGFAVMGRVNTFAEHEKKRPERLVKEDFVNYLSISKRNAECYFNQGYFDMVNIINFGKLAGASQTHPHSQDGVVRPNKITLNGLEREVWGNISEYIEDIFGEMINIYRNAAGSMNFFAYENERTIVVAPFAPRVPDQLDIIVKPRNVSNLLEMCDKTREDIADSLAKSVNFLATRRGVSDFNVLLHQSTLNAYKKGFRLHFHIMPRNKNTLAGFELNGIYVVDTYPEKTAEAMREYLSETVKT